MSNRQRKAAKRARRRHSTPPSARAGNRVFPPLPDWLSQNSPQNSGTVRSANSAFPSQRPPWAEQYDRLRVFAQREPRSAEPAEPLASSGLLFGMATPYPQTPTLAEPLL
ncbi:MAG TPA: hypothetical protein VHN80_03695, partial [Kineosporiaceae bacterium]|nr:hypothetical protein [Kineosporiaceae bacterium]